MIHRSTFVIIIFLSTVLLIGNWIQNCNKPSLKNIRLTAELDGYFVEELTNVEPTIVVNWYRASDEVLLRCRRCPLLAKQPMAGQRERAHRRGGTA
jgi:hypothetical protein